MAAQHRLEARLEALVVRRARNQFVTEAEIRRRARALAFLPRIAHLSCSIADDSPALDAQQPHKSPLAVRLDAAVMLERGVERIGEKAKRGQGERAGPAGGVAYRQRKDFLGKLRCPARGGRIRIRRTVRTGRWIVSEWAQGTLHGGDGEPRAGIEASGALAGAAPAHQVPLPGKNDTGDELFRLGAEPALEPEAAFRRAPAAGFPYETGDLRRTAGPCLRPGTALLPFVQPGREVLRRSIPDLKRQRLVVGFLAGLLGPIKQIRRGPPPQLRAPIHSRRR